MMKRKQKKTAFGKTIASYWVWCGWLEFEWL